MATASSSQQTLPSPTILLFARGVVAILDLWPALTIAVAEQWGGPESADKKVWIASTIIDEWEQRTTYLPAAPSSEPAPLQVDPADAKDPALDLDDLADLLNQMMTDEFDANLEDGSIDAVASDIIKLWHDILIPPSAEITPELLVGAFEQKAAAQQKKGIQASRGADPEEGDHLGDDASDSASDDDDDDDEEMDMDEAPQLVSREPKEKAEPVVDDDGFTLVQSKGRKGR